MILDALKFGYGMFRDQQARSDAKDARPSIQRLVKDARKAGIHPLAAMGSNIAGGYGSAGSVYSGNAAGDALNSVQRPNSLQTENARLQNEALKADIERTRADTARIVAASATSRSDIARAVSGTRNNDDSPVPVKLFGGTLMRDANRFSSADRAQQEYGEIAEHIVGLPAMFDAAWRGLTAMPKSIPSGRLPGSQWSR